jgi:dTDP-4-dehydrorhamnose 3,5-epimerase
MRITTFAIEGVLLVEAVKHGDERGFFSETYRKAALEEAGFTGEFVQDNQSFSSTKFTVRGLHFQLEPHAQDKLIRVTRGAILDVAVDIRAGSKSYGQHVAVELSAENWRQLLVPRGFAHGFQTLSEECEVQYKVTDYYAPSAERGLLWNDPALSILWPETRAEKVTVNTRDAGWPCLSNLYSA